MKKELKIMNEQGLHMRPSSQIVSLCEQTDCEVVFEFDGRKANAKNIMELMFLSLNKGDIFTVHIKSNDPNETICKKEEDSIYTLLKDLIEEKKFGES